MQHNKIDRKHNNTIDQINILRENDILENLASRYNDAELLSVVFNNPSGQFYLANLFCKGSASVKKNLSRAFFWFNQSSEGGCLDAQVQLGICYQNGFGIIQDEEKAFNYFYSAAKQGLAQAQTILGACYEKGKGTEKNLTEAVKWYALAAMQGNVVGQFNFGICLISGLGIEKNPAEAVKWFEKAAIKGHVHAQISLANCLYMGNGIEKNKIEAAKWFAKAAKQGNARAQYSLGICYKMGDGLPKNDLKAFQCFSDAANQDYVNALDILGTYYELGIAVKKDQHKAMLLFQKAAEKDFAQAQWNLGVHLLIGTQIDRNEEKALYWIQQAAKKQFPLAQYYLNKKIGFHSSFIVEKALVSKNCFVPYEMPTADRQFLYLNCGIVAFATAVNYSKQLQEPLSVGEIMHQLFNTINPQLEEEWRSKNGEIFDVEIFMKLAAHYKINGCKTIIKENYTEDEYQATIINLLENKKVLVAACDADNGMPVQTQGKNTHWVCLPGHWYNEENISCVAAVHNRLLCEWLTVEELFKSNEQLPIENPHKPGGHLKNFRNSIFAVPLAEEYSHKIINNKPSSRSRVD